MRRCLRTPTAGTRMHCQNMQRFSIQRSVFNTNMYQPCESCRSLLANTGPLTSDSGVPSTTGMHPSAEHTTHHAPIIPHDHAHPVPPPHAQVQQPPRESLYVPIELGKVPRKVRRIAEVAPARPAVCPGGLLAGDERGPRGVRGQDVVPEVGGEGLADEWGVRWACDFGEREWGAWAWARP